LRLEDCVQGGNVVPRHQTPDVELVDAEDGGKLVKNLSLESLDVDLGGNGLQEDEGGVLANRVAQDQEGHDGDEAHDRVNVAASGTAVSRNLTRTE
jgi:hypothetical protein